MKKSKQKVQITDEMVVPLNGAGQGGSVLPPNEGILANELHGVHSIDKIDDTLTPFNTPLSPAFHVI